MVSMYIELIAFCSLQSDNQLAIYHTNAVVHNESAAGGLAGMMMQQAGSRVHSDRMQKDKFNLMKGPGRMWEDQ